MSVYVDPWENHQPRATVTVHEDPKEFRVMWRGDKGKNFRAIIRQRPNPIGFHAKLPGDRRR